MRETKDLRVNKIPSPTWRWLSLNDHFLSNVEVPASVSAAIDFPSGVELKENAAFSQKAVKGGMGGDFDKLMDCSGAPVHFFRTKKAGKPGAPVSMTIEFDDSQSQSFLTEFELCEGSRMTAIMDIGTEEDAAGLGALSVRYALGKGAHLTLIQLIHAESGYTILSDIGGVCDEKAHFSLVQIVIGSGNVYLGASSALSGKHSMLDTKLAYMIDGSGYLDVNYVADHTGKKTSADISAGGVLRDVSKKVFRGTIDFKKGCAGAVGSEIEDVLLMNEGVINQTIPVILCSEEDVEGSHGATIGKLSDEMLFYMMSRGMELTDIYELMARARIEAVSRDLPTEELREKVSAILDDKAELRKESTL